MKQIRQWTTTEKELELGRKKNNADAEDCTDRTGHAEREREREREEYAEGGRRERERDVDQEDKDGWWCMCVCGLVEKNGGEGIKGGR